MDTDKNKRFAQLRTAIGLSMEKFGEKIDLSTPTVSMIEKGERNVTDRTVKALVREYGANEQWLRTGVGEMLVKQRIFKDNFAGLTGKLMRDLISGEDEHAEIKVAMIEEMLKLPPSYWEATGNVFVKVAKEINNKKGND